MMEQKSNKKIIQQALPFEPKADVADMLLESAHFSLSVEPTAQLETLPAIALKSEPICDTTAMKFKLPAMEFSDPKFITVLNTFFSLLIHLIFCGAIFFINPFSSLFVSNKEKELPPLEISFGISDIPAQSTQKEPEKQTTTSQPEALKTAQQLPQLTQSVTLDTPPQVVPPPDTLPQPQLKQPLKQQVTPVLPQPDPQASKKLSAQELLRRAELEQRKVGAQARKGVLKPSAEDIKNSVSAKPDNLDLPKSPFDSEIPKAPPALLPAGSLQGRARPSDASAYHLLAHKHMQQHWKLPKWSHFDENLKVVVQLDIDGQGKILGALRILKSSGNKDFDAEALRIVQEAGPFPLLPSNMNSVRLNLKLDSAQANMY